MKLERFSQKVAVRYAVGVVWEPASSGICAFGNLFPRRRVSAH